MTRPSPPHLECSFYTADQDEPDVMMALARHLELTGATFTGEVIVARGENVRDYQFAVGVDSDASIEEVTVDEGALHRYLISADIQVLEVGYRSVFGRSDERTQVLTYSPISLGSRGLDKRPLTILAEGLLFTGTFFNSSKRRASTYGNAIYSRFIEVVESLRPSYGAITIEVPLRCPHDLRANPKSRAFYNFYISSTFLRSREIDMISRRFDGAYIQPIAEGIYISCFPSFNPFSIQLDHDQALQGSYFVSEVIGDTA